MRVTYDYHEFFSDVKMISDYRRFNLLGLKPYNVTGIFWPDQVHCLLEVCASDARFHIVTYFNSGIYVNRYDQNGDIFELAEGMSDPEYMLDARHERDWILGDHERK